MIEAIIYPCLWFRSDFELPKYTNASPYGGVIECLLKVFWEKKYSAIIDA